MDRGTVRAFDTETGQAEVELGSDATGKTGAANAWAWLSVDAARDMVFIPTGSASPDFYGGLRPGDNRHANSVVALRASTGKPALVIPGGSSRPVGLRCRLRPELIDFQGQAGHRQC